MPQDWEQVVLYTNNFDSLVVSEGQLWYKMPNGYLIFMIYNTFA
jgi:hypothetical protein